ncbi:MAG: DUF1697 domain-containing protein [Acidimicrobiales bacterium]
MNETTTWVGLLRGINVGGHRRLPMADLRALVADLGHQRVRTHKQSGNLVFESENAGPAAEQRTRLEAHIERTFGFGVTVIVHRADHFRTIAATNPYPGPQADPATVGTVFLAERPDRSAVAGFVPPVSGDEQCHLDDDAVHLWCPAGFGRTKLTNSYVEKHLGVSATTRNWATILSVIELTEPD